jgi:hypothetical protein
VHVSSTISTPLSFNAQGHPRVDGHKTIFNAPQMPVVIEEIERLRPLAQSGAEERGLQRLLVMADHSRSSVHTYVRFIGD